MFWWSLKSTDVPISLLFYAEHIKLLLVVRSVGLSWKECYVCKVKLFPPGLTIADLHGAADSWGAGMGGRRHQHKKGPALHCCQSPGWECPSQACTALPKSWHQQQPRYCSHLRIAPDCKEKRITAIMLIIKK